MSAEKIIVEIESSAVHTQKGNLYDLMLAKKVNGVLTIIWQSRMAKAGSSATYQSHNEFDIKVDSYGVGYTNDEITSGSVTFTSSEGPVSIDLGQTIQIDSDGLFGPPINRGTPGTITIENALGSNPHEILYDSKGRAIFINKQSGMDKGTSTLTPQDEYQLWFQNHQKAGSIIVDNISNCINVVFGAGDTVKTVSFSENGDWQHGGLAPKTTGR